MSVSEQEQATLAQGEWRMTIMNEVHDLMSNSKIHFEMRYTMKKRNELAEFLFGIAMLIAGGYWFMASVTVTSGFFGMRIGGFGVGGLVIVPFIIGIFWWFFNPDSFLPKLLTAAGMLLVLVSVILSTRLVFANRNLYEYVLMLILIFGGLGLVLRVMLKKPKTSTYDIKHSESSPSKRIDRIEEELEELKYGIK